MIRFSGRRVFTYGDALRPETGAYGFISGFVAVAAFMATRANIWEYCAGFTMPSKLRSKLDGFMLHSFALFVVYEQGGLPDQCLLATKFSSIWW